MQFVLFMFVCIFAARFCNSYLNYSEVNAPAYLIRSGNTLLFLEMEQNQLSEILVKLDRLLSLFEKATTSPATEFLSRQETADFLKVSLQTVQNYIDNGTLPAQRIGTRIRLKKTDVLNAFGNVSTKTKKEVSYVK